MSTGRPLSSSLLCPRKCGFQIGGRVGSRFECSGPHKVRLCHVSREPLVLKEQECLFRIPVRVAQVSVLLFSRNATDDRSNPVADRSLMKTLYMRFFLLKSSSVERRA